MQRNKIKFYHRGKPYFEFTNFAQTPFNITKVPPNLSPHLTGNWKTSEHLFQAAKFTDKNIIEKIRQAPDTGFKQLGGVFWLANSRNGKHKENIRGDWFSINLEVMHWVVKEKFTQNESLKDKLLGTGEAELIEASEGNDNFWGKDKNGKGANNLGKILERVRSELTQSQNPNTPSPQTPPPNPPNNVPNPPNQNNNNPNQGGNHSPSPTNDDGSTPSPADNDNSDKGNENNPPKNDDPQSSKPNESIPPTNNDQTSNKKTLNKTRQLAQQKIKKLIAKSKIKVSDLDASLWENKGSWEEYLKSLENDQKIAEFVKLMERKIKEKDINLSNKPTSSNKVLIIALSGGVFLLVGFIVVFIVKKIRETK